MSDRPSLVGGGSGSGGGIVKNYGAMDTSRLPEVEYSAAGGSSQFSPTEMYDLSENITINIYTINASWKQLQQLFKAIGTNKDSQAHRDKVHVTQSKSNQIIEQTTKDLQRLTMIVRRGDKHQRLQVNKLTASFKEAVNTYSRIQKQVAEKMKFHLLKILDSLDPGEESGDTGLSGGESEQQLLAKQKMLTRDLEFDQGLIVEREQRIKAIEEDILDVNQIMKELSSMVLEQAEQTNSIENAVESSHATIEAGNEQLEKAASYQNKQRRTTCILLGISIIVGILLAITIAVSLR